MKHVFHYFTLCLLSSKDSLSSGDDEDYDEDPEDAGIGNGESLFILSDSMINA